MPQTKTRSARNGQETTSAPVERRPEQPQGNDRHRPVHEVRLGAIKAAVWANDGAQGVFYNVTLSRVYKDRQGSWQSATTFGRDDLLVLAKVADRAHTWICEQSQGPNPDTREVTG